MNGTPSLCTTSPPLASTSADLWPPLIQGGMGVWVSNHRLASAVASAGGIGVISGTALDTVMVRRLQDGDPSGEVRLALAAFPDQELAAEILGRFFIPGGRPAASPYRLLELPCVDPSRAAVRYAIAGSFVETFLAKRGHQGLIGMNQLDKIPYLCLPTLFGAMLAGLDLLLVGAGLPMAMPGLLLQIARGETAVQRFSIPGSEEAVLWSFLPSDYMSPVPSTLTPPRFLAIVSSALAAKTLLRRASGPIAGFIVEHHRAGGHNAPPRRKDAPAYGPDDEVDFADFAKIGLPFYIAGGQCHPNALAQARSQGAKGLQIGSAFALSQDSGIDPGLRHRIIRASLDGTITHKTDMRASPTGFPFKVCSFSASQPTAGVPLTAVSTNPQQRRRRCDLGYLRTPFRKEDGSISYRCPSEPAAAYLAKQGAEADLDGRLCLCNGLLATVNLGQHRSEGDELPLITLGDDLDFLHALASKTQPDYPATAVLRFLNSDG